MPIVQHSEFTKKVMQFIHKIPAGNVATYKQIAELAGKPQGSRGVAWILHTCSTTYKLPWHRVLNSQGKISFERATHNFREQKRRLEKEGVIFSSDIGLSLAKFQWRKKSRVLRAAKNKPKIFTTLQRIQK